MEEMLQSGTIVETLVSPRENCSRRLGYADTVPDCSIADIDGEYPMNVDEDYRKLVAERRKGKKNIISNCEITKY